MNDEELQEVLRNPQRILNVARVFHQLLHHLDKMEEDEAKNKGITKTKLSDILEVTCKDKDGKLKAHIES